MPDLATDLVELMDSCEHDPLEFVRATFPWGEPGMLADHTGPREWQADILRQIGEHMRGERGRSEPLQVAVSSGHGIGKSALVSWIVLWSLATREHARCVVTANTADQLRTKTWPEVTKWANLALFQRHGQRWFDIGATSIAAVGDAAKTWRADALTWSEHNTEAFAGLHNQGARILLIFDEASAIHDRVWEVAEGALTDADTEIAWLAFGNPTRNVGRFAECFGRLGHRWAHRQIDSRTVPGTNAGQIAKWVDDYGEDSDFVRVRVRGVFPRAGSMQFIPSDVVAAAAKKEAVSHIHEALVLGVDVARFGDDESVLQLRRGRDARTHPARTFRGLDTMQLAGQVGRLVAEQEQMGIPVDAIFCDETGVGAGVVDRLRQLGHQVVGVNNGSSPDAISVDGELVANKGAECWAQMRSWLKTGGAIADDAYLRQQLEGREYGYNAHNAIVLERKDDMKKRGLASPDRPDALALTFAQPVVSSRLAPAHRAHAMTAAADYDPLA